MAAPYRSSVKRIARRRRYLGRGKLPLLALCGVAAALSVLLQGSRPALAPAAGSFIPLPILRGLFAQQAPTPSTPDALFAEARRLRLDGSYEDAASLYRQALQNDPAASGEVATLAAEASLAAGDDQGALDMAALAVQQAPEGADAYLIQAQADVDLGQTDQALGALRAAEDDAPLAGYAAFREGELDASQGDDDGARSAYARALGLPMARLWQAAAGHRIGLSYMAAGDPSSAVSSLRQAAQVADQVETADPPTWFDRDLVAIRREARRPPIVLDLGRAQQAAGATDDAATTFAEVVTTYPTASEAADALDALDALGAGGRVSDYWRGRALYAAGRPRNAIAAFADFMNSGPQDYEMAAALYYTALANGDIGNVSDERQGLETVGYSHPESVLAPDALAQVGKLLEAAGAQDEAIDSYNAVARMYPGSDQGVTALLRVATLELGRGDVAAAQATWRQLADAPPTSRARAQALFWLGRSQLHTGDRSTGVATLDESADTAPSIYEGIRARDLSVGGPGADPYTRLRTTTLAAPSDPQDEAACADWIGTWASSSDASAAAPILDRIRRLVAVGLTGPAMGEALDAATDLADQPAALDAVARGLSREGLVAGSINAANRLAAASPAGSIDDAPGCVGRLAYPVPFDDLVRAQATQNGLDPYVLLALLRQESWFDSMAQSGAPAYGLAQITSATASDIARNLGRQGFAAEDLFRPSDAIQFGAWYLAQQTRGMNDRVLLGLAAYNAGPGNVLTWAGNNRRVDPDDFVNAIGFAETRTYVRSVYEIYARYRSLYGG